MRAAFLLLALAACANEYHPEYHPQSQYAYTQTISQPITVFESNNQAEPVISSQPKLVNGRDPSRILVLEGKHLPRQAEVVGVVDAHEAMGKQDAALWLLKQKAAAMGADAIVGVEFHHGEGEGEPTHLSGLAVRFLQAVPYPVD